MGDSFDWDYPGLSWSRFHSLANLLSLRNDGQAELSSLSERILEGESTLDDAEDGNTSSTNTRRADQITDSGHEKLKRRFLDCLAEFAANRHGGIAVACSAMKEAEDNVIIFITRNEGFADVDQIMFDKLAEALSSLSRNAEMVLYHQGRIEHSYIPNLRASLKAYDAVKKKEDTSSLENSPGSDVALSALRALLFDDDDDFTSTTKKHDKLIFESYNLRQTRAVETTLHSSPDATFRSKNLWVNICLLARLLVAFQKFKEIALALPSFGQVKIILVPRPTTSSSPTQHHLSLKKTFRKLQLDLNPVTAKAVLGQNWTVAKANRKFAEQQQQRLNVHAEIQMLMFFNTSTSSASEVFPYLGCSKLSCFMCKCFIRSYGQFTSRGCHGRLFRPWTIPRMNGLLPSQAERIAKALKSVQHEVEQKLKISAEGHFQLERTSAIGGSSVLSGRQEIDSHRQLQIDRFRIKAE
ncbi:MAG: hypothetical protein Q9162_003549 [Coniocarpon cinnabarinum]